MTAKSIVAALLGTLFVGGGAKAQTSPATEGGPAPVAEFRSGGSPTGISSWIIPWRACCEGTRDGKPIETEFVLRAGPSIPIGATTLGRNLNVGFMIQGGFRTLFFNDDATKAWTVETSLSNNQNSAGRAHTQNTLSILLPDATGQIRRVEFGKGTLPGVTIRSMNRTFVNLGLGREWYVQGSAEDPGNKWRWGIDGGGRYGSGSMNFREIRHRTDVMGGVFLAAHTDLEIPVRWGIFQMGLRTEWAHTWSDILQRSTDVQDLNLMATFGVRY